ncbi:MAG: efflux RND transporter permease subunit [bacterium]
MINKLVDLALDNRLMAIVLIIALVGFGIWSFQTVPINAFPDVTPPMAQVFTTSPGLSPVDVEKQISYPIEVAMYGIPNLKRVQSTSIFGLSRVSVYFEEGTDVMYGRRLVLERLSQAKQAIPKGLGSPKMGPMTTGLGRIFMYRVKNKEGYDHSLEALRTAQDWIVKPQLRTIKGITGVLSIGGDVRQFQVQIDNQELLARDLSVADVRSTIQNNNRTVGGSFIERGGEEYIVRGYGWIDPDKKGLKDLRNTIVKQRNGTVVYLDDVAEVTFGPEIKRGTLITNEKEGVGGFALKLINTNTQTVLNRVEKQVEKINKALPEGMEVAPYYSQASLIEKAISTVEGALLEGAVLVLVFLWLFLGNVRSTLIVIATLPISALVGFIGMYFMGMSANLMSLGGLAIGIGMMVDGAVVVIENIFRHLEEREGEDVSMLRLVREATHEVARPVVFAISIIIIVFLPLFTLQGTEGKMFSPMAFTISFALVGAVILALTKVPVLSSLVFSTDTEHDEPRLVTWSKNLYEPVINNVVNWPVMVISVAVILLLGSLALFPYLGSEFIPTLREGTYLVRSVLPPSANLNSSVENAKRIQEILGDYPEVEGTYSRVGRAEVGGDPEPVNVVATMVKLKPLPEWESGRSYEELQSTMAEELEKKLPGLANNFSQPIRLRTNEMMTGIRAQGVVSIYGEDLDVLKEKAQSIEDIVKSVDGAVDVRAQQQSGKPQVSIRPDRQELARLGITIDEFMNTIETGIGGSKAGKVFEGVRRFDIFVRLQKNQRDQIETLRQLPLKTKSGSVVPVSQVAEVDSFIGPKRISRNRASRRTYVQFNVRGRDMGGVVKDIQDKIDAEVDFPAGYFVEYGGQFEAQQRAMKRLYIVVPLTMALIFLMLFSAFGSLRYATLIFLNVPFAVIGGIFALWVSGLYLSVPAAVGFIAVFGVAVLNGVVLVDYINQLRDRGYDMMEAVVTGAKHRLRPVLMTATVAILGLVPLLLANDIGSNVQRPLAAVVVGGLVTSTILTLVVLPSIYRWFAVEKQQVEV